MYVIEGSIWCGDRLCDRRDPHRAARGRRLRPVPSRTGRGDDVRGHARRPAVVGRPAPSSWTRCAPSTASRSCPTLRSTSRTGWPTSEPAGRRSRASDGRRSSTARWQDADVTDADAESHPAIPAATVVLVRDGERRCRGADAAPGVAGGVRRHVGVPRRTRRRRRPRSRATTRPTRHGARPPGRHSRSAGWRSTRPTSCRSRTGCRRPSRRGGSRRTSSWRERRRARWSSTAARSTSTSGSRRGRCSLDATAVRSTWRRPRG